MSLPLMWAMSCALTSAATPLEWNAPPGCPKHAEVQAELDRFLGERSSADGLSARVDVTRAPGGLLATVNVTGFTPRTLHADDCTVLARANALVIAVAVDPVALAARTQPPPEPHRRPRTTARARAAAPPGTT